MIRGFYTALSGIIAAMSRQAVVADNIANVSTRGFKQSFTAESDFELELYRSLGAVLEPLGPLGTATLPVGPIMDRSAGPLETTGVPTDFAIEGDGLFAVQYGDAIAYTRAGDFVIDAAGVLTTQSGQPVLDVNGARIVVPGGAGAFTVATDGTIRETGQRLALVAWPAGGAERLGGTLLTFAGPAVPGTGSIRQGSLERSNVDLGVSMTQLITFQRALGLSSRAMSIQDETLAEATRLGLLR